MPSTTWCNLFYNMPTSPEVKHPKKKKKKNSDFPDSSLNLKTKATKW